MILQSIILILTALILVYCSIIDMKKRIIHGKMLILIIILGITFIVFNKSDILNIIYAEALLTMFFLIGAFFGMGWGDMYLFWSLGLFFDSRMGFIVFLSFSIASGFIWIVTEIDKRGMWLDFQQWIKIKIPLIPSITTGFVFFVGYTILEYIQV
jgi:Flp pilus assembly protein protease CpaA